MSLRDEFEFKTEADLCAAFNGEAARAGWTVYPEQGGWDVLLVRGKIQVGIQAKLFGGVEVLLQALPPACDVTRRMLAAGPHFRAILVDRFRGRTPKARRRNRVEVYALAAHLRVVVLEPPDTHPQVRGHYWVATGYSGNQRTRSGFPRFRAALDLPRYRWRTDEPVWTPPFVPTHPAGVPSPRTVSPWQIAAVKLELRAKERLGWVCLGDARAITENEGGTWNPKTLLSRYYVCTSQRIEGSQQRRWVPRKRSRASTEFPEVWENISG